MKKKKIEWYCYVCGKKVNDNFYLISMNKSTDRVFLICNNKYCIEQVENNDTIAIKIKREESNEKNFSK